MGRVHFWLLSCVSVFILLCFVRQFEGEDSFTGNGSFGDSMGAVER